MTIHNSCLPLLPPLLLLLVLLLLVLVLPGRVWLSAAVPPELHCAVEPTQRDGQAAGPHRRLQGARGRQAGLLQFLVDCLTDVHAEVKTFQQCVLFSAATVCCCIVLLHCAKHSTRSSALAIAQLNRQGKPQCC
jgi:hypothetical protein